MCNVSTYALPIGTGGFGAIYRLPSSPDLAFKVVKNPNQYEDLHSEFEMIIACR